MKRVRIENVDLDDGNNSRNFPKVVKFSTTDGVPCGAKFAFFKRSSGGQGVLTATTERLSFVNTAPPERMFLAAINRSTGSCRLVSSDLYHMCPVLPSTGQSEDHGQAGESQTAAATASQLGETFGMARWKKIHQKSARLRVSAESLLVGESLDKSIKDIVAAEVIREKVGGEGDMNTAVTAERNTSKEDASTDALLPPCDWHAVDVKFVYSREKIIPEKVWKCLQKSAEHFNKQLMRHQSNYIYIKERVAALLEADTDRFIMVSYMFYMLRLLTYMRDRFIKLNWKQLEIPDTVLSHLRVQFMERSHQGWSRSTRLMDKMICYLMVVALWVHQYTLDLSVISAAVKLPLKTVKKYARLLGMTVAGTSAVLKLPLFKPPPATSSLKLRSVAKM